MGFFGALTLALIVLKLIGAITISWLTVAAICVGVPFTLIVLTFVFIAIISALRL